MNYPYLPSFIILSVAASLSANTWDGDGVDSFWNTGGNWVEGGRPGFAGTATFTGDPTLITNPDLNGNSQTGIGLDFQTSGWTIFDGVGGANFRTDGGQVINSLGTGENRLMSNAISSGGNAIFTVDPNSVLRFSGGVNHAFSTATGGGLIVVDTVANTGGSGTHNISGDINILINTEYTFFQFNATSGVIGGTGTFRGFGFQTSNFGGTAVLSPGGNGVYGSEIGTMTWQAQSATDRHNLSFNSGSSLDIQIGATLGENDLLQFESYGNGAISIGAGTTLNLYGEAIEDGSYTIVSNVDPGQANISGAFETVNFNGQPINPANFTVNYNGDNITVDITGVVPEPSHYALLAGTLGLVAMLWRRR
ncbi:PEP-CTERM sorting domain-containing protein [Cerasicoccus fimbriatus]|uniref:PEP-CTERM sorting domain-containing protein n=1 Tax=Cerasicoccus fimbriatus TaxID=3014554 RepID=UPI0022B301B8|nr:PEP-CTERM sorting domain-containing protein [Cerasicoccus sp. TK19100]